LNVGLTAHNCRMHFGKYINTNFQSWEDKKVRYRSNYTGSGLCPILDF